MKEKSNRRFDAATQFAAEREGSSSTEDREGSGYSWRWCRRCDLEIVANGIQLGSPSEHVGILNVNGAQGLIG